jgi:hypothetical protein
MYTKDYFLSLIKGPFLTQISIPGILLQDNDIVSFIIKYNWLVNTCGSDEGWITLIKSRIYRD